MKNAFLLLLTGMSYVLTLAQSIAPENPYQTYFEEAYVQYPDVPGGMLEAVSFTQTRLTHLDENIIPGCTGMPRSLGLMGLVEDGKGYFRENLQLVAFFSGYPVAEIKTSPRKQVLAYAKAFDFILGFRHLRQASAEKKLTCLEELTEIPMQLEIPGNDYAFAAFLYSVATFMNDAEMQAAYNFPNPKIDLDELFGPVNKRILQAQRIVISKEKVTDELGHVFQLKSSDYGPALWNAAPTCNYSSRNGTAISAVTIHTVQGSYSGCISWFQNCSASVSAHYVVRSSDGQITQMVLESDKAWHVGTENPYTIGIEHEGYVNNASWYTTAMYNASSALVSDICNSGYGINRLRTGWWPWLASTYYNQSGIPGGCTKIKGHQHYPNQTHTDPGPNWDWNRFFKLLNPPPSAILLTTASGNFYDLGGSASNYADDQRAIWTIAPPNATSVTVTFTSFNLENTWDYIYIYDGADINAPLIGYYTGTTSPGTITSSGGALTVEFRSDCATTANGFSASWTSAIAPTNPADSVAPTTQVSLNANWQTQNFNAAFADADNAGGSGLEKAYYQVIDFDGTDWYANAQRGFFNDGFDQPGLHPQWTTATGSWSINSGVLQQTDESLTNTNIYGSMKETLSNRYLYHFSAAIGGSGSNRRAGFHFFCDSAQLTNRGNGYFVWFRVDQSQLEFYKVTNDVFAMVHNAPMTINAGQWYDYKVIYDRITGKISVYQDNVLVDTYTDPSPYSAGKYISFRSGNSNLQVNNLHVYRSRVANGPTTVTLGNCAGCDIRYQNTSPAAPSGIIRSLVADSVGNLSSVFTRTVNVDWTSPAAITTPGDGDTLDIDTTYNGFELKGNWSASTDIHSDIARYWYTLGTAPGDSNIVNWTDNWFWLTSADSVNLTPGTTYYLSVRAENGAGLISTVSTSDGVIYLWNDMAVHTGADDWNVQVYPNPFTDQLQLRMLLDKEAAVRLSLLDMQGREIAAAMPFQAPAGWLNHSWDLSAFATAGAGYILRISVDGESRYLPLMSAGK